MDTRISAEKRAALNWIAENEAKMTRLADKIWGYAEPALREYRSARAHCEFLQECGFRIERNAAGMPTAFVATYGEGKPVIATYAEMTRPRTISGAGAVSEATRTLRGRVHRRAPRSARRRPPPCKTLRMSCPAKAGHPVHQYCATFRVPGSPA